MNEQPVGEKASIVREVGKMPITLALILCLVGFGWYFVDAFKTMQDAMIQATNELNQSIAASMAQAAANSERQAVAMESIAKSAALEEHDDNALLEMLELMKRNQGC